jgi:ribosomal protein S27AE
MAEETLDSHVGQPILIDVCMTCQSLWFDTRESLKLSPASTLKLFRTIGDGLQPVPGAPEAGPRCPRCGGGLRPTHDMQRTTRFEYLSCPNGHGRLTSFYQFLREKDFIKPLSPAELRELRAQLKTVNCSNCGAAVDLAVRSACGHCGSALSILDLGQAGRLVEQLRQADRSDQPADPTLPLRLERARREAAAAFDTPDGRSPWMQDASGAGLVGAGLLSLARWLNDR